MIIHIASCQIPTTGWAPWSVCRSFLLQNLDWPDYGCQWRSSLLCLNLKLSALKIWWKDGYFGFRLKYVRSHFILESGIKQWWKLKVRGRKMVSVNFSGTPSHVGRSPHLAVKGWLFSLQANGQRKCAIFSFHWFANIPCQRENCHLESWNWRLETNTIDLTLSSWTRVGQAPIFADEHRCASDAHQCAWIASIVKKITFVTKILWFWTLIFHSWGCIKPSGMNNNDILGTQNWKQSQADPFLAQKVATFGKYLYVDNVNEIFICIRIRIFAQMRIISMNRIFRICMANPSKYHVPYHLHPSKQKTLVSGNYLVSMTAYACLFIT